MLPSYPLTMTKTPIDGQDHRYMEAAIRLGRWHLGRTGTNPSVATILVKNGMILGSGITGLGGRPHAEAAALAEAGKAAQGATAYVTLEPCAHHGRTPPCAEALVRAGVARVVSALTDPDDRVSGAGYQILKNADITVNIGCEEKKANAVLGSYLARSMTKRAQVTLKLAVSSDGMIGKRDTSNFAITGSHAKAQSHILRSQHDAILIGVNTALGDDPALTCRLPGMAHRSPTRIVLDTGARLPIQSQLVQSVDQAPLILATANPQSKNAKDLAAKGVRIIACASHEGRIALPELMEDLAAIGITRVLVEGGAQVAHAFLAEKLVEQIALFESDIVVGHQGIASPFSSQNLPDGFRVSAAYRFGVDRFFECEAISCSPA
ncbi:MAG: bifunctional diaminohydroxyphosphoribosylaminopyrimidine deaminase/5-amino-6-(5-phosphoribosylamino)uracil reductase RibD [Ahrensia sp.]|nr:bifunctional diaminohydroxyphosphoribosylaminopyrimidine deaminase/5-amino-6-(5-phosphoribosylamino)uracil reductase RibD [Ahrensia sp.]